MLGAGPASVIARIHAPIARGAFAAGLLIVLVDIAKELPATLLLRPFNFETLATRIYRLASDERLSDAAPAALILVALSLAPVLWLEAIGRAQTARTARSTLSQIKST
jgi:iron(III) transport system permease protein